MGSISNGQCLAHTSGIYYGEICFSSINETDNTAEGNTACYLDEPNISCTVKYCNFMKNIATSRFALITESRQNFETFSIALVNNTHGPSDRGLISCYAAYSYIFRECIIKNNKCYNFFYGDSQTVIQLIKCVISNVAYSQYKAGNLQSLSTDKTKSLSIPFALYESSMCFSKENYKLKECTNIPNMVPIGRMGAKLLIGFWQS
ncbi:hypothetical protein TVAG_355580 [Trichomonas vaginalis G3]|uniref:Uncharacterized protein n=1 Tax=Trichomonas vaginalis (strain ATCC PRA-98 / G3) TaxID=412133 RepID=A2FJT1_TRIV3|nr:hypothetical protein TVAGG3_0364270 [Trichomonas vaginalis G3]EAX94822.1 hypothetical protein TVAG_355580 [Trichomonas vaginalis G3]KAI5532162.1 hypothetical protein TVAGG3_0364270 [Trichomonas vaginalis G3]|eukprot:XP_001307752.1 hypothetical protein [Trichomonas vaginalis G3]